MAVACVPDVISTILERVPDLVSLFRCSLVCKEWRGLVTDPAFLRRRGIISPHHQTGQSQSQSSAAAASLVGIFVQRERDESFPTRRAPPALVPAPGSALGPQRRFLTSFLRDSATPLAARHGLLLVRIFWPPPRSSTDTSSGAAAPPLTTRLCVCNLLTGGHELLPPLDANDLDDEDIYGYALLTAADSGASAGPAADGLYSGLLFEVLLVGRNRHACELALRRFSSSSSSCAGWAALDCTQVMRVAREPDGLWGPYAGRAAAVARGAAHWLLCAGGGDDDARAQRFYTLSVSAGGGTVAMRAVAVGAVQQQQQQQQHRAWWLCTVADDAEGSRSGSLLALFCVKRNNRLVMVRERDDRRPWDFGHVTQIDVEVEEVEERRRPLGFGYREEEEEELLSPVCVGERSGTVLAIDRSDPDERAYVIDLASGSPTRVEGWSRSLDYMTAVPFEIDWEMFFVSRLKLKL